MNTTNEQLKQQFNCPSPCKHELIGGCDKCRIEQLEQQVEELENEKLDYIAHAESRVVEVCNQRDAAIAHADRLAATAEDYSKSYGWEPDGLKEYRQWRKENAKTSHPHHRRTMDN